MNINCPQCQSKEVIDGKIYNQADYINPPAYFRPNSLPFYAIFNTNVQLDNSFFACSFCGLIWSKIDNQKLHQFLAGKKTL